MKTGGGGGEGAVISQIMTPVSPKDSVLYSLEPGTMWSYMARGTLYMGLRLGILRCGDYPGLSRWFQSNHINS